MLVQNYQICNVVCLTSVSQFFDNIVSAIDSVRIREYQPYFLVLGMNIIATGRAKLTNFGKLEELR